MSSLWEANLAVTPPVDAPPPTRLPVLLSHSLTERLRWSPCFFFFYLLCFFFVCILNSPQFSASVLFLSSFFFHVLPFKQPGHGAARLPRWPTAHLSRCRVAIHRPSPRRRCDRLCGEQGSVPLGAEEESMCPPSPVPTPTTLLGRERLADLDGAAKRWASSSSRASREAWRTGSANRKRPFAAAAK